MKLAAFLFRKILLKAADIFEERRDELKNYQMKETGALEPFMDFTLSITSDNMRDAAGRAANVHGATATTATPGQSAFIFKER